MNRDEMRVVQIGLKMLLTGQAQAVDWNIIMAGTIIAMLPSFDHPLCDAKQPGQGFQHAGREIKIFSLRSDKIVK